MAVSVALTNAARGGIHSSKPRDCVKIEEKVYCEVPAERKDKPKHAYEPTESTIAICLALCVLLFFLVIGICSIFDEHTSEAKKC